MNIFHRSTVPKWAKTMSESQFEAFRAAILNASANKLDPARANKDGILVHEGQQIGVVNLVASLSHMPEADWAEDIERWVRIFTVPPGKIKLKYPEDLKILRIQLYGSGYFSKSPKTLENSITQEVFPGVIATVVVDTPDMVFTLNTEDNPDFKTHAKEVTKFCYEQIQKQPLLKLEYLDVTKNGDTVACLEGPDIMSATQVLAIKDLYPQLFGNQGFLFAVPNRHLVFVKPIIDDTPAQAAAGMRKAAQFSYDHNPQYCISPEVYMYKDGKYAMLQFKTKA